MKMTKVKKERTLNGLVLKAKDQYKRGLITETEFYYKIIQGLNQAKDKKEFVKTILKIIRTAGIDFKEFATLANKAVNEI